MDNAGPLNYPGSGITSMNKKFDPQISGPLKQELGSIIKNCNACGICVDECAFLKQNGNPLDIASSYEPDNAMCQIMPFECSLCGLCTAVCNRKADPHALFMEMRNESVKKSAVSFNEHARLINYERKGTSKKYSYYSVPENCTMAFFPGCNLPGSRPDKTYKIYELMKKKDRSTGIVLDCCTKPSLDLGKKDYFNAMFGEMRDYLVKCGVKKIITACPNCYRIFKNYGSPLKVESLYEYIEKNLLSEFTPAACNAEVAVHDPCSSRNETRVHSAVRAILTHMSIKHKDMTHTKNKTICCGEGGAVSMFKPELACNWTDRIKSEAHGNLVITSCGGCANYINSKTRASHILDILFEPEKTLEGKAKVSSWPFTYFNRTCLKKKLKKNYPEAETRERTFSPVPVKSGSPVIKLLILIIIVASIIAIRKTGAADYLQQDRLRTLIAQGGMLGPVIYMALYVIGTVLFLPGLAISIVGGILFGPFWGVVYTITSATAGACAAFLISRYAARGWIENKIKDPRLRSLDDSVEKNGWKIIAFTRLIPLFPFNLLNYAFGLTKVRFSQYAIGSFIFMLPGCIAFIVFSSSLLDLVNGKISKEFVIGIVLIAIVSAIPVVWRRIKMNKDKDA